MNVALDGRLCEKTFRSIGESYRYLMQSGYECDLERCDVSRLYDSSRESCRSLLMNGTILENLVSKYTEDPRRERLASPPTASKATTVPEPVPGPEPGPGQRRKTPSSPAPGRPPKSPTPRRSPKSPTPPKSPKPPKPSKRAKQKKLGWPSQPPATLTKEKNSSWAVTYRAWMKLLDKDMAVVKKQYPKLWECDEEMLQHEQVQVGIEAVWGALYHNQGPQYFITDTVVQQYDRDTEEGGKKDTIDADVLPMIKVCGRDRNVLIMAIQGVGSDFRHPTWKNQNTSHHVIVVAERASPKDPVIEKVAVPIKLSLYNSVLEDERDDKIYSIAKNLAERCGWLRVEEVVGFAAFQPVEVVSNTRVPVPKQTKATTCGLHAILNSWAFMLNIPIHPAPKGGRRSGGTWPNFYKDCVKLVTAAAAGRVRLPLIQAFFNTYGYSSRVYETQNDQIATQDLPTAPGNVEDHRSLDEAFLEHKKQFPGYASD